MAAVPAHHQANAYGNAANPITAVSTHTDATAAVANDATAGPACRQRGEPQSDDGIRPMSDKYEVSPLVEGTRPE